MRKDDADNPELRAVFLKAYCAALPACITTLFKNRNEFTPEHGMAQEASDMAHDFGLHAVRQYREVFGEKDQPFVSAGLKFSRI